MPDFYVINNNVDNQLFLSGDSGFVEETEGPPVTGSPDSGSTHTAVGDFNGDGLSSHGHLAVSLLCSLTSKTAETQGKGSVLATKTAEAQGKGTCECWFH